MIEEGIRLLLLEQTGDVLPGGLWPITLPENAKYAAGTVQLISVVPSYTMDGPLGDMTARIQLDVFADKYSACAAAMSVLGDVLDGFSGDLPNKMTVGNIFSDGQTNSFDSDSRLYRIQSDWKVQYDA